MIKKTIFRDQNLKTLLTVSILFLLSLTGQTANAKNERITSLKQTAQTHLRENRTRVLYQLALAYDSLYAYDSAAKYAKACIQSLPRYGSKTEFFNELLLLASIQKKLSSYNESLKTLGQINESDLETMDDIAKVRYLLIKTSCFGNRGDIDEGLILAKQTLSLALKTKDDALIAQAYQQLGNLLGTTEVTKEVMANITHAFEYAQNQPNRSLRADMALSLSGCYQIWKNVNKRNFYLDLAIKEARLSGDSLLYLHILCAKMEDYANAAKWDLADSVSQIILPINRRLGSMSVFSQVYFLKYKIASAKSKYELEGIMLDSAIKYYELAGAFRQYLHAVRERLLYSTYVKPDLPYLKAHLNEFLVGHQKLVKFAEVRDKLYYQEGLAKVNAQMEENHNRQYWGGIIIACMISLVGALGFLSFTNRRDAKRLTRQATLDKATIDALLSTKQDLIAANKELAIVITTQHKVDSNSIMDADREEKQQYEYIIQNLEQVFRQFVPAEANNLMDTIKRSKTNYEDLIEIINSAGEKLYPGFQQKLAVKYPTLSALDRQMCILILFNIENDVIALLLNITDASFMNRRSMIRKKLGLERRETLESILLRL